MRLALALLTQRRMALPSRTAITYSSVLTTLTLIALPCKAGNERATMALANAATSALFMAAPWRADRSPANTYSTAPPMGSS